VYFGVVCVFVFLYTPMGECVYLYCIQKFSLYSHVYSGDRKIFCKSFASDALCLWFFFRPKEDFLSHTCFSFCTTGNFFSFNWKQFLIEVLKFTVLRAVTRPCSRRAGICVWFWNGSDKRLFGLSIFFSYHPQVHWFFQTRRCKLNGSK